MAAFVDSACLVYDQFLASVRRRVIVVMVRVAIMAVVFVIVIAMVPVAVTNVFFVTMRMGMVVWHFGYLTVGGY